MAGCFAVLVIEVVAMPDYVRVFDSNIVAVVDWIHLGAGWNIYCAPAEIAILAGTLVVVGSGIQALRQAVKGSPLSSHYPSLRRRHTTSD